MINIKSIIVLILSFFGWVIFSLFLQFVAIVVSIEGALVHMTMKKFFMMWLISSIIFFSLDCLFFVPMMRKRIFDLHGKFEEYEDEHSQIMRIIIYSLIGKYFMVKPF